MLVECRRGIFVCLHALRAKAPYSVCKTAKARISGHAFMVSGTRGTLLRVFVSSGFQWRLADLGWWQVQIVHLLFRRQLMATAVLILTIVMNSLC
jgi:hypothetical protein